MVSFKNFSKIQFDDFFYFLFLLLIFRQCAWIIPNNMVSWILSFIVALLFMNYHLENKESINYEKRSSPPFFIIIVIVPLLVLYFAGAVIPDVSVDVMNYHITNGDRALTGPLFREADFFPAGYYTISPIPDMLTAMFRFLLGYRLGTLVNLLLFVWTSLIVDKFLSAVIQLPRTRYIFIFLILSCEYCLGEMNSYMIDFAGVPLLLEAIWAVTHFEYYKNKKYYVLFICFLIGLSVAMKMINLAYSIPILILLMYRIIRNKIKICFRYVILCFIMLLTPTLPFGLYLYAKTSNPVFPFYNSLFKSPYFPLVNYKNILYSPKNFVETVLWPVVITLHPGKASPSATYSGRLALGLLVIIISIKWCKKDRIPLMLIWIIGALLWPTDKGFIRYALFLEILGGMIIVYVLFDNRKYSYPYVIKALKIVILSLFLLQVIVAYKYLFAVENGLRFNIFKHLSIRSHNVHYIFHDYRLTDYLSDRDRKLLGGVGLWVNACWGNSGIASLLNRNLPMVTISDANILATAEAMTKFSNAMTGLKDQKKYAICSIAHVNCCKKNITERALQIGDIIPLHFSIYGSEGSLFFGYPIDYQYLIEVRVPENYAELDKISKMKYAKTSIDYPLPDEAFQAKIKIKNIPSSVKIRSFFIADVEVRNVSPVRWPSTGLPDSKYKIHLSYHWLNTQGQSVWDNGIRTSLPYDIKPGQSITTSAIIEALPTPGLYILEFDMLQESVAWFSTKNMCSVRKSITLFMND